MNISRIFKEERICKAISGMSRDEINKLLTQFDWNLKEVKSKENKKRKRAVGGGRKGVVPEVIDKLIMILFYIKCYPTYDLMGIIFNLDRSQCCKWVKYLLPILEQTLGRSAVLPKRQIHSMEEFVNNFSDIKDIFIDGTERRIEKPVKLKRRNKLYSGKKKGTTRKNIVVSTYKKEILILTKTKSGRRHDKRLTDKETFLIKNIPDNVTIWGDTGFIGIEKEHKNTILPKKATKNHPLTPSEKESNRLISSIRVVSEHAIAGIKRFASVTNIYRNKSINFDDKLMLNAAGLWNFHLKYTA